MDNYDKVKPAKFPDTYYYGIQPMICSMVAEMDDMSVQYPTQAMHEAMVDRAYNQLSGMYPDEFQGMEQPNFNPAPHAEQFFPPFRRRPLLRDFISILILQELFNRRRFHRF